MCAQWSAHSQLLVASLPAALDVSPGAICEISDSPYTHTTHQLSTLRLSVCFSLPLLTFSQCRPDLLAPIGEELSVPIANGACVIGNTVNRKDIGRKMATIPDQLIGHHATGPQVFRSMAHKSGPQWQFMSGHVIN